MEKRNIIVGIDCGLKGAIAIFESEQSLRIWDMPVIYKPVRKRNKAGKMIQRKKFYYDLPGLMNILRQYLKDKVCVFIERQGVRPREGAVSAMTIGQGYGTLIGMAYGLGFDVNIVEPKAWKKMYKGLDSDTLKESLAKKMKDVDIFTEYSKDKLARLLKVEGKIRAREIATELYPMMAKDFSRTKDDGRADALLLGLYGLKQNELVQKQLQSSH